MRCLINPDCLNILFKVPEIHVIRATYPFTNSSADSLRHHYHSVVTKSAYNLHSFHYAHIWIFFWNPLCKESAKSPSESCWWSWDCLFLNFCDLRSDCTFVTSIHVLKASHFKWIMWNDEMSCFCSLFSLLRNVIIVSGIWSCLLVRS